ncbi:MAG: TonB-dependent receptor [Xanthomonadaceae bacterium]|jgi:outer membrane receptor protein involved in Fe transport|nr:TonB-dependent receptor [Xanthomonadaceae bacterium]
MNQPTRHLLAIAIAAALAGPALAAPDPAPQSGPAAETDDAKSLETITVTARRVDEELQKVPLPISAITADTIEEKGFTDVRDIAAFTPSFSFRSGFGRDGDRPVIRGMSNIQGEPNASFFIDGVYVQGDISGYGLENLERVEVIRGPQSAAFGRRTFSGAVNFVTRRPGNDPTGKFTLGGGSDGQRKLTGFYSGPIVDDLLSFDIGAVYDETDGLFYNPIADRDNIGGTKTVGMLTSVLFRPLDNLELLGRFGYQQNRDQHFAIRRQGSALNNCFLPEIIGTVPGAGFPIGRTRTRGYFCGVPETPDEFPINTPDYDLAGFGAGLKRDNLRASLVGDWTFGNNWTLTSTSAYNETEEYSAIDQDYSEIRGFGGAFETFGLSKTYDWSQDLRITTDTSAPVYGILGAYYYSETRGPGFNGSLSGFNIPPANVRAPVRAVGTDPVADVVNRAVYGFVEWKIDDQWTASFEVRYAKDEITAGGTDTRVVTTPAPPRTFTRSFLLEEEFTSTTPRATLSYQWTDDVQVYGLASKGTKPGGFNTDVQRADLRDDSRALLVNEGLTSFAEEEAWNYEIGFKSDLLDDTLRLNANLFWIDWQNQQLTESRSVFLVNNAPFLTSFTTNIGESRISGLEVEGQWVISPSLLANFSYSYNDAEIRDFISQDQADLFCNVPVPNLADPCANAAGNVLPRVPKNQAAIGLTWSGEFANGWGWFANGDVNYESTRYTQVDNLAETGSGTVLNLRFGVDVSANWRWTLWVNNVTDDDTAEDILRYVNPAAFISIPNVLPAPAPARTTTNVRDFAISAPRPRMYGFNVTYRF